MLSISLIW